MNFFEQLTEGEKVADFTVTAVYENRSGRAMGARFTAEKTGFIVDLLQIESVPQAFYWIKTIPSGNKGEPHTCEHLLLGKGKRGKYTAALGGMSLSSSSAYTSQVITAYHFNTTAGVETFYTIFEAKLMALLHPDFIDEEIRREVAHVGVVVNPEDGALSLEEKGTVYTEMVSGYEKPWSYLWGTMDRILYGDDHPLSYDSGGEPSAIRTMVPEDLWSFHKKYHHLSNMGSIVSIPQNIDVETCLTKLREILDRCQDYPDSSANPGIGGFDFPEPEMRLPFGDIELKGFPSDNADDPGKIQFAWPAYLEYSLNEGIMFAVFWSTFANGPNSNLYKLFVNSRTRQVEPGICSVFGSISSDQGHPVRITLNGVDKTYVDEDKIKEIRGLIRDEIRKIHEYEDGSDELEEFTQFAVGNLERSRKWFDQFLDSPPMFGFRRGTAGAWVSHLETLEKDSGFRKSLVLKSQVDQMEVELKSGKNIWKEYIDKLKLRQVDPYAVAISPDTQMVRKAVEDKKARIAGYIEGFKRKYEKDSDQDAIAEYRAEFDLKTVELEARDAEVSMPEFVDNPPMTLDDQLNYEIIDLDGDISCVASTFDNMTSSTFGIAFKLDVIPQTHLVYVPFLPAVTTRTGVVRDGEVITYDKMQARLQREVLGLNSYFSFGIETGRAEIVLSGAGSSRDELLTAIDWMDASLNSPYLDVENIPRMMDIIDQSLNSLRNTMKRGEESWVDSPVLAYRYQTDPLFLSANCFLTQIHHFQRLKWMLTDAGDKKQQKELSRFLDKLIDKGKNEDRSGLLEILEDTPRKPKSKAGGETADRIVAELKTTLSEIPDETLSEDWRYLCEEIEHDLLIEPEDALAEIRTLLQLIFKADNARAFMISNRQDREETLNRINELTGNLDTQAVSKKAEYTSERHIENRLLGRLSADVKPVYVGLINNNTRNGVINFTVRNSNSYDTGSDAMLDFLAGKLYSGAAAHGLFMRTWASGLAYSNGFSYRDRSGMIRYYAERCPDVAETMRFVVDVLKNADVDSTFADYVIGLSFERSRAPDRYEARGETMAADIADGFVPDVIAEFRRTVLETRQMDGFLDKLRSRMEDVYGKVLVGYGQNTVDVENGNFFLIGPEEQFVSLENYIASVEGQQTVYRLYPRDYWLVR